MFSRYAEYRIARTLARPARNEPALGVFGAAVFLLVIFGTALALALLMFT